MQHRPRRHARCREVNKLKDRIISKEEFCKLYGESKDRLYRYALYKLGDPSDAEDAVSETVLAAWQGIDKLKSIEAFAGWLFAILKNNCSDKISSYIREREKTENAKLKMLSDSSSGKLPASLSAELAEALAILKDEDRELVLLSVIGGFSSSEISEMTGLAAGTIRSKLSRSLAKMREFLS